MTGPRPQIGDLRAGTSSQIEEASHERLGVGRPAQIVRGQAIEYPVRRIAYVRGAPAQAVKLPERAEDDARSRGNPRCSLRNLRALALRNG